MGMEKEVMDEVFDIIHAAAGAETRGEFESHCRYKGKVLTTSFQNFLKGDVAAVHLLV